MRAHLKANTMVLLDYAFSVLSSSIMAAKNTKESEKGTKIMCVFFTKKAYNGVKSCQNHYNYILEANQVPHIGFDQYIACRRYNSNMAGNKKQGNRKK